MIRTVNVQGPDGDFILLQVPAKRVQADAMLGQFISMSKTEAIELAARLIFLADGALVKSTDNNNITAWNYNCRFLKAYAELMNATISEPLTTKEKELFVFLCEQSYFFDGGILNYVAAEQLIRTLPKVRVVLERNGWLSEPKI